MIHSTLQLQTSAIFVQGNSRVVLVFNAIQGRIPARIPPIPEAITRGEFDWEIEKGGKVESESERESEEERGNENHWTFSRGLGKRLTLSYQYP